MKNEEDLQHEVRSLLDSESSLRNCIENIYVLVNTRVVRITGTVEDNQIKKLISSILSRIPDINLLTEELSVDPFVSKRRSVDIDWIHGTMQLTH